MDGTYSTNSGDKKCTQVYLESKQKRDHFGERSKCENNTIIYFRKKGRVMAVLNSRAVMNTIIVKLSLCRVTKSFKLQFRI